MSKHKYKPLQLLLASLALHTAASNAEIYDYTGNDFYQNCRNPSNVMSTGFCWGFIEANLNSYLSNIYKDYGKKFTNCYTRTTFNGVIAPQLSDTFIQWLKEHPAKRNWTTSCLFINAIAESFPAPKKCYALTAQPAYKKLLSCKEGVN